MRNIIKYVAIFMITVLVLFLLLIITAKIPRSAIEENIKKATDYFDTGGNFIEIKPGIKNKKYSYKHIYADAMLLNIIYFIDNDRTIESVMEGNYYATDNWKMISYDFNEIIEKDYQANVQYIRYWHGSMSIIRPLLVFFTIEQIYIINAIVLLITTSILLVLLIRTKIKELVFSYIIGLIMCAVVFVPFCLEYFWTFLIMTVVSIIAIIMNKKRKDLNILFMISGMITCYLDFLSTELITLLIPMLFLLVIKYKNENLTFKEAMKLFIKSPIFWSIGYAGMWAAKWILASIILDINALNYVVKDILYRINGVGYGSIPLIDMIKNLRVRAIKLNVQTLFPIDFILQRNLLLKIIIPLSIIELILIRKKELKKLWFSALLLIIAAIPYIRYAVLASHSFSHYFFTFRAQIISIIAIILAIVYSIDLEPFKKQIKIRKCR